MTCILYGEKQARLLNSCK